ncbi:hypothetical protein PVAP13_6NG312100 [Panicum virgatum]|uniref:HMA domain-containing protein n=2 Tax=Panicum virgatum TaxID=38727 RepID=A0A8T0R3U1_PANVG|nr:hypothetical protein PVAP13_6NG312100 [Panicum virgatum]
MCGILQNLDAVDQGSINLSFRAMHELALLHGPLRMELSASKQDQQERPRPRCRYKRSARLSSYSLLVPVPKAGDWRCEIIYLATGFSSMESTELKVEMVALHEKRVRKCLSKVKGIERVEVEASLQKVVVTGCVNRSKILKALRRVGLRAEPWAPHNELLSAYATTSLMSNNSYSFF